MKSIRVRFEYLSEKGLQNYDEEIDFPEQPPVAFHAMCQMGYHVLWAEKMALKARIEELEAELQSRIEDEAGASL